MSKNKSKEHNPLSKVLGLVLKELRHERKCVGDKIAEEIGISSSYYRLVESGSASLSTAHSLNLIRAFNSVEFEPVSLILNVISIIEKYKDPNDLLLIIHDLENVFPSIKEIFDDLKAFIEEEVYNKKNSEINNFFLEKGTHQKLKDYITIKLELDTKIKEIPIEFDGKLKISFNSSHTLSRIVKEN